MIAVKKKDIEKKKESSRIVTGDLMLKTPKDTKHTMAISVFFFFFYVREQRVGF